MKIKKDPEAIVKLMDRIQCMRDYNFEYQEIIEGLNEKKNECCVSYNAITLRDIPITLRGQYITLG